MNTNHRTRDLRLGRHGETGSALIFYVVVLTLLGALAAGMLTLFDTASNIATSSNFRKYAYYMAESGLRYGISMLKSDNRLEDEMQWINQIPKYKVDENYSFEVQAYALGTFESTSNAHITGGSLIEMRQPGGQPFPEGFEVPTFGNPNDKLRLINKNDLQSNPSDQNETYVDGSTLSSDRTRIFIQCSDSIWPSEEGIEHFLAVKNLSNQTMNSNGMTIDAAGGASIFPVRNGIVTVTGKRKNDEVAVPLRYDQRVDNGDGTYTFTNLRKPDLTAWANSDDFKIGPDDLVVLNTLDNQNIWVTATGYAGPESVSYELTQTAYVSEGTRKPKGRITHDDPHNPITSDPSKNPLEVTDEGIILGGGEYYAFGALWYSGTKRDINLQCIDGECDLGTGIRIFFTLQFEQKNADGFVYVLPSAETNDNDSVGGDSSMGELLAYAGDSRVYPGTNGTYDTSISRWVDPERNGIQPPKIGVEFDTYLNAWGGSCICSTDSGKVDGTRIDPNKDHIAYVYWGNDTGGFGSCYDFDCKHQHDGGGTYSTTEGEKTYDDNMHGKDASTPNGLNLGGSANVFTTSNINQQWYQVQSGYRYAVRIELHRALRSEDDTTSTNFGKYGYQVKTWVYRFSEAVDWETIKDKYLYYNYTDTAVSNEAYLIADLNRDLTSDDFDSTLCSSDRLPCPVLTQEFWLDTDLHDALETTLLGFVQGTGAATQIATVHDYEVKWRSPSDDTAICTYPLPSGAPAICTSP